VIDGIGVLDLSTLVGGSVGSPFQWLGQAYTALRPSLDDLTVQLKRTAQIVTPKDAAHLLRMANIGPGDHVGEAGAGSGALTLALAHAVGPTGKVHSFDRRDDFLESARLNVERAGWSDRVEFRQRDVVSQGIDQTGLDGVLLDLPEPWAVLESARRALKIGSYVATFTPTYNQLERTVRALRSLKFDEVRSVELIERALHVGEGGTRPEFEMLGHTGFLASGRRLE